MSSTKKTTETVSFVHATNPEVLTMQPRPGGAVPIVDFTPTVTSTPQQSKIRTRIPEEDFPIEEKTSREFRVQTALDEVDSIESTEATLSNPLKDAMYMISVAISTVMMMAAEHQNIPEGHLQMTQLLLESVTDDYGNHPPNVQGILNHLKLVKSGEMPTAAAPEPDEQKPDEEKTAEEKADEPKPEEEKADEPKPDEETPDEQKPEETKNEPDENPTEGQEDDATVRTTTSLSVG